jgi:uncharacterized membrane protein
MILLILGIASFIGVHTLLVAPPLKARVLASVDRRYSGLLIGILSVITLILIVAGWRTAGFVSVYEPPAWGWHVNYLLTFLGFLCLGIFLFRGRLRQRLRYPMAFAVLFWGTGHLFANGDLASIVLFGGFIAGTLVQIAVASAYGYAPSPEVRAGHDLVSLLIGAALYGAMTQLHPALIGVPVFNLSG